VAQHAAQRVPEDREREPHLARVERRGGVHRHLPGVDRGRGEELLEQRLDVAAREPRPRSGGRIGKKSLDVQRNARSVGCAIKIV